MTESPSASVLPGFCFGQCRFDDGAFAVHLRGLVCAFGVRCQIGQFVLGLGLQLLVLLGFFAHQAMLARFKASAGSLSLLG